VLKENIDYVYIIMPFVASYKLESSCEHWSIFILLRLILGVLERHAPRWISMTSTLSPTIASKIMSSLW
jgi:hypothetical protein